MATIVLIGLIAGCAWGGAGLLGFHRYGWKPGLAVAAVCAIWSAAHDRRSPEVVEAISVGVFLVLMFVRQWLMPRNAPGPDVGKNAVAPQQPLGCADPPEGATGPQSDGSTETWPPPPSG